MAFYRTNMITTKDRKLVIVSNNSLFSSNANFNVWKDTPAGLWQWNNSVDSFNIQTKDFDFGNPSRRKKIYKVYVTFKAGGYMSGVIAKYATNGSNSFTGTFNDTTYYSASKGFDSWNGSQEDSSADWITVALKPTSTLSTSKIYSLQLKFEFADTGRHSYNPAAVESLGVADSLTLDSGASAVLNYYSGMPLYFYKGPGAGETYRITSHSTGRVSKVDSVEDGNLTNDDAGIFLTNPIATNSFYDIGFIPKQFEINDITVIYREKSIK